MDNKISDQESVLLVGVISQMNNKISIKSPFITIFFASIVFKYDRTSSASDPYVPRCKSEITSMSKLRFTSLQIY